MLPPGAEPRMGPISTGLGEIYMWTVGYRTARNGAAAATAGRDRRADGSYLTPEGQRLRGDFERAAYLRTVQDWIIRPQLQERERASPASMRSAATSSSTTCSPTRRS